MKTKILLPLLAVFSMNTFAGVVVVNESAPEMTKTEIIDFYLGRVQTMSNGKKIELLQPTTESEIRKKFELKVVGRNSTQLKALWTKLVFSGAATPPMDLDESEIIKRVARNESGVGYVSDKSLVVPGVKVVLEF